MTTNPHYSLNFAAETGGDDPLLEGLACLLSSLGRELDPKQLAYGFPLDDGKLRPAQIPQLLQRHQVDARVRQAPLAEIPASLMPCLLLLEDGSSLMLQQCSGESYRLVSPVTGGELLLDAADLDAQYSGWSVFAHARSTFRQSQRYAEQQQGHWFKSRLVSQWRAFAQVMLASLLASVLAIATALFAMQVYDRVVPTSAFGTLWALAIGVLLAVGFEFLLKVTRGQVIETLGKRIDLDLSQHIFQHATQVRLANKPASVGAFANQIRDFEAVREFFTAGSLGAFGDLPFVIIFLAVIAVIGGPLVLVPVGAMLLMLLPAVLLQPWLSRLSRDSVRESAVKNGVLLEAIDHLETLKVTHGEGRAEAQWQALCEEQTARGVSFRNANGWLNSWAMAAQQLASVSIIIAGVYLIDAGQLTIGALIACSLLTARAISPTVQVNGLMARWQHIKVALEGLDQLMAMPIERPAGQRFIRLAAASGHYSLNKVSWRYSEDSPAVVELDQLTINAGEHLALLGGNGAGKSTLLKLLSGLYAPQTGELLLDQLALSQIDPADRRRAIAYLPQDIALFHGSLRENLTLQVRRTDDQQLLAVLDMVGLGEFVRRHPLGLDLPILNNHSLSGGQRQSVGLARLVLQDPKVVLLDEPTSALDQHTENQVIERMGPWLQGRTLILATHKRPLLQWVERAMVMREGRRVQDGPLAEILSMSVTSSSAKPTVVKIQEAVQ